MTDAGLTSGVADAAAGANEGGSAFSFTQDQNGGQQQTQEQQGNPAWNELLGVLPTQLHSQVKPHLEKWDRGVQDRFTQLSEQYSGWKPFIEQNVDPGTIQALITLLENDPRALWEQLGTYHGFNAQPGQGNGQQAQGSEFNLDEIQPPEGQPQINLEEIPEYQQMKLQLQQLQGFTEQQVAQQQQQQFQQELETELEGIREKNPGINENLLLSIAHTFGMSPTDAVAKYNEEVQKVVQANQRPAAPPVLAPNGGVPLAQTTKVSEMNAQQRKSLVQAYLERAASDT